MKRSKEMISNFFIFFLLTVFISWEKSQVVVVALTTNSNEHDLLQQRNNNRQPWPLKVDHHAFCCSRLLSIKNKNKNKNNKARYYDEMTILPMDQLQQEAHDLDECLNEVSQQYLQLQQKSSSLSPFKVAVVTLASQTSGQHHIPNIDLYAPYQRAIVGAYSEFHRYHFEFFRHPNTTEVEEEDYRWNKVPMLIKALDPIAGWAKDTEAIVWIDSDAVILDFGLTVEKVLQDYPQADFIASADIKLGLINTGLLIIRNTAWSRWMLQRWWMIANRSKVCDQEAFDQLYTEFLRQEGKNQENAGIVSKVKILSTDCINSHPPSWKYQTTNNQVLHLMGESAVYRAAVFRKGFHAVCDARSGGMLSPQLSLDKESMLDFAIDIYKNETQQSFIQANKTGSSYDIEELFKSSHHYVDILYYLMNQHTSTMSTTGDSTPTAMISSQRRQYKNEIVNIRESVLKLTLHHIAVGKINLTDIDSQLDTLQQQLRDQLLTQSQQHPSSSTSSGQKMIDTLEQSILFWQQQRAQLMNELVILLKKAAEAGNSLFWVAELLEDRKKVAALVFDVLNELITNVVDESKSIPLHMKALMFQNLAVTYYEKALTLSKQQQQATEASYKIEQEMMKLLHEAEVNVKESVAIFDQYFTKALDSSTRMEHLQSLQLHAGISCMSRKYMDAQGLWLKAIEKARENHGKLTVGIHYERLAIILYNAAICFAESGDYIQSRDFVREARKIIQEIIKEKYTNTSNNKKINKQNHPSLSTSSNDGGVIDNDTIGSNQLKELKNVLLLIESFNEQLQDMLDDSASHMLHRREHQELAKLQEHVSEPEEAVNKEALESKRHSRQVTRSEEISSVDSNNFPKLRAIKTEQGIKYVHDDIQGGSNKTSSSPSTEDDYEWEECSEFDTDGCETFLVVEDDEEQNQPKLSPSDLPAPTSVSHTQTVSKGEESLYEGMDEEEIEELMEVRRRYAKLTGIADLGSNSYKEKQVPKPTVVNNEVQSGKDSCNCEKLQKLTLENEGLRRHVKELQTKLEHIAALVNVPR